MQYSYLLSILFSAVVLYRAQRWLFRTRAGVLQFKRDNKDIEELQPIDKVTHTVIEQTQPLLENKVEKIDNNTMS